MTLPRLLGRLLAAPLLVALSWAVLPVAATTAAVRPSSAGDTLTVAAAPGSIRYGATATVSGVLTGAAGAPVAGAQVVAEARRADGSWTSVAAPAPTDGSGTVAFTVAPTASSVVRLRQDGDGGAVSPEVTVSVHVVLGAQLSRAAVPVGAAVTVAGSLSPAPAGAAVRVERLAGGGWQRVAAVPVAADGSWSVSLRPGDAGFARYRAVRGPAYGVRGSTVELPTLDVYRLHRYSVTTRGRVTADLAAFRTTVAATYADPRGWLRAHHRFREVARGGDFTVVLSQPRYLPSFSRACSSSYSCRVGRFVVINEHRWERGSPYFPADLLTYRRMVVDHETGHWLGRDHAYCSGPGALAPVMQQQSKGMQGCRPNPWPLPGEIHAVS